ncbi:MAG: choice-of-anchor V domain-containing protein [Myxococcota bacterium]
MFQIRTWSVAAALLVSTGAVAFSTGIDSAQFGATGCPQCHNGGTTPLISLFTGPATLMTGQAGTFTVQFSTPNGPNGGFNLSASAAGTFSPTTSMAGAKVKVLAGANQFTEATHDMPKADADDGVTDNTITFEVEWAPAQGTSGTVTFTVWTNSVNLSSDPLGDMATMATTTVAVTCVLISSVMACAGKNCGTVSDGCGGSYTCGTGAMCPQPFETCGGGGTPNVCGCTPTTCLAQGKNCDSISDTCGGMLSCGSCTAPQTCGGGGTNNVCGCTPTPQATACANKNCGDVADGCGGTSSCGSCTAPQTCGGGGTANVCGCSPVPMATACAGKVCGVVADGCGGSHTCGTCATGVCANNVCTSPDAGTGGGSGGNGCSCGAAGPTATFGWALLALAFFARRRFS